jgi:hypothetical protein
MIDEATFQLRRRVMNYLYEARNLSDQKLPWIKVRIVPLKDSTLLGVSVSGRNEINISEGMANWDDLKLKYVVFHELCHKYFGGKHLEKGLMNPIIQPLNSEEIDRDFMACARMVK